MPIHLSLADVGPLEEEYVLRALRSGWVAPLGPEVDAFESEVAERVGVDHALALNCGTAALHLALMGVGAGQGTAVLVPSLTFAATANAVVYAGAEPVFVDALSSDGNVDPGLMLEVADALQAEGTTVSAAVPVDLLGRCVDYSELEPGLSKRGIALVEDAAEALGATRAGRAAGSFGRVAALSFNGNKIMTTSGGGMLLSNDADLVARARLLSAQARQPVPWYEHVDIGYNYRMSNILAALGRAQLARLDKMIGRRLEIRALYAQLFADLEGVRLLGSGHSDGSTDNGWLTTLVLSPDRLPAGGIDVVVASMSAAGIEARHLWKPMHLQPVFRGARSFLSGNSEHLFAHSLNLPSGARLRDSEVEQVAEVLCALLGSSL